MQQSAFFSYETRKETLSPFGPGIRCVEGRWILSAKVNFTLQYEWHNALKKIPNPPISCLIAEI
eukprot:14620602-Ditylum_brightwellii.AAC.1